MRPFEPIGDRARWRIIYEMLQQTETGQVITYRDLAEALDLDARTDRHQIQMAVRRAARELEEADKRALDVIPNTGYVIVPAPEHLTLARRQQKKSFKALARGQSKVINVDLTGVDAEIRHAFEITARAFAWQMQFNKQLDVRQAKLEQAVNSMTQRTQRTEEEIAELKARLARLEGDET